MYVLYTVIVLITVIIILSSECLSLIVLSAIIITYRSIILYTLYFGLGYLHWVIFVFIVPASVAHVFVSQS